MAQHGTLRNKQTGQELTGNLLEEVAAWRWFHIDGTASPIDTLSAEWDFTPGSPPKPRIPDDAKFITWTDGAGFVRVAVLGDGGWNYNGEYDLTTEELIETYIGDETITVLDERRDQ